MVAVRGWAARRRASGRRRPVEKKKSRAMGKAGGGVAEGEQSPAESMSDAEAQSAPPPAPVEETAERKVIGGSPTQPFLCQSS